MPRGTITAVMTAILLAFAACSGGSEETTTSPAADDTSAPATTEAPATTSVAGQRTTSTPVTTAPGGTEATATTTETTEPRAGGESTTTRPATTVPPTTVAGTAAGGSSPPTSSATTTTTGAGGNRAPSVSIVQPADVVTIFAELDQASGAYRAAIRLVAQASDPDGDPVRVEWFSNEDGPLGSGTRLDTRLTAFFDTSVPIITAVAVDARGAVAVDVIEVVVFVPSE